MEGGDDLTMINSETSTIASPPLIIIRRYRHSALKVARNGGFGKTESEVDEFACGYVDGS